MSGGASMGFIYAPNKMVPCKDTINDTLWHKIGVDGTAASASNLPWPNLDPGGFLQSLLFRSESNTGSDGSAFYIAFNSVSITSDTQGELVSGTGQTIVMPGNVWNVWLRKSVATDLVALHGAF